MVTCLKRHVRYVIGHLIGEKNGDETGRMLSTARNVVMETEVIVKKAL